MLLCCLTSIAAKKGEDYFKYNRTEFLPRVPYLIAKDLSPNEDGYDGEVLPPLNAADWYMPQQLSTVGHVRAA